MNVFLSAGALHRGTPGDLGNHFAAAFHIHVVTGHDIQAGDFVKVVQCGPPHGHPAQFDGFQFGYRAEDALAADLEGHGVEACDDLLFGPFIRNHVTRRLGGESQKRPLGQVVEFDHQSVDGIGQGIGIGAVDHFALAAEGGMKGDDFFR